MTGMIIKIKTFGCNMCHDVGCCVMSIGMLKVTVE